MKAATILLAICTLVCSHAVVSEEEHSHSVPEKLGSAEIEAARQVGSASARERQFIEAAGAYFLSEAEPLQFSSQTGSHSEECSNS